MPPKNEEVKIPDVKIPDVKINIDSGVKKLKLGFNVKQEVMKSLPYSTTYQRLNNARALLNYEASKLKTSGERKQINQILEDCLKLLDEFYSGKTRETANKMDANQFAAGTDKVKAVFSTINSKLDNAIKAYEKYLKEKDPDYPKNGEYQLSKPSDKYIYRYIALDELKEISQICKVSSMDNTINLIGTGLKNGAIKQVSVDDIFTGRQTAIRSFKNKTIYSSAKHTVIGKIPVAIDILKQYSEIGNKAATDLYNKIKNIDLTVYAKAKDGKYPTLTKEDIEQLKKIQATIKEGVKAFLDKVKATTEDTINQQLIPETVSLDGIYTEDAIRYRKNLQTVVGEIDEIADEMKASLEKAEKHPELFTLPIVFKGPGSDEFLGDTSFYNLSVKLSELKTSVSANNDSFQKVVEANSNISFALRELDSFVNSLYEIGEDGTYKPTPVASIDEFQRQIAEVEKVIRDNENNLIDNLSDLKKDEAKKIFSSMKNILKDYKAGAEKTKKECEKLAEGTFDRNNVFIVANIHPDQNVRKQLNKARQDRIQAAHDEAERIANSNFDGRNMDAETILTKRLEMIKNNRHFSVVENKNACEKFFSKYEEMLGFLGELYARDNNGGFTHFANDEERAKLEKLFVEVRAEIKNIPKYLPKKEYDNTLKSLFSSIENEIQSFEDAIQGAIIYGTYPIAEFLDAGKFGYPSIADTRLAAYGLDRYDLNKYKEKNDQEWVSYDYYKNPLKKINHDIAKLQQASSSERFGKFYSQEEKQWLTKVNDFIKDNFTHERWGMYFEEVETKDERLGINVTHFPLMTKEKQDELRKMFHELNKILQEIGASDKFSKSQNHTVRAFLNGLATYTQQTEHRLTTFHSDLDLPIYTIQEATSGRADTSAYNYRNEPEKFARIHQNNTKNPEDERKYLEKLTKAGVILKDEDKFEAVPDQEGKKVRKKIEEKQGYFSKIYTKIFNKNFEAHWEYARDLNDFYEILEKVKNFENKYLANFENGDYQELPITHADVPAEGFDGPIKTYEQLKWCYTQIQFQAMVLKDKVDAYNKDNAKDPIPASLSNALQEAHNKGLILQTIIAMEDAHRTKGDSMNVAELIHSHPVKRKNLWTIRQYKIFHNHRQEKGQLGTFRNLKHFETEYNSEMTYNGRFYEKINNSPMGDDLKDYLEELKGKYSEGTSDEAKAFVAKLLNEVAKDPNKISEFIPTVDEFNAEEADYKAILETTSKYIKANELNWESEKDREMIKNVIADLGFIGIDKYDHKERSIRGAKYGENLIDHFNILSTMSERLGFDNDGLPPYQRLVPKTHEVSLTVPGEVPQKTYTGMIVESTPDRVGHLDGYDRIRGKEQKVAVNVLTGKQLKESTDPDLISIDGFNNNPNFIKQLASLQTLCFLCNAPMPKFDDLRFAIVPNKEGIKEVQLMSYMPDPAFMEKDDFEGKVNLEDLLVIPEGICDSIKSITGGNKKKEQIEVELRAFAESITDTIVDGEAKDRINKVIMKKAEEMSKAINDKKRTKIGSVMDEDREEFYNGIRDNKILVTEDFAHLTIDKLTLKPNIFQHNENGRTNIFTEFANLPERVYKNISEEPGMNDENPKKKKAYVDRFVNGVKRETQRLNIEATLALMTDKHDEYWVHKRFQKDSDEFKQMHDALMAVHIMETTGIINFKKNNQPMQINIFEISDKGLNGVQKIDDDIVNKIRKVYSTAREKVNQYIEAKTGTIFKTPFTDLGSRRYEAAIEIRDKLSTAGINLNKLQSRLPVKELFEAPKKKAKEKINANNLAAEENANGGKKVTKVNDGKAKDSKVENKKEEQKEKDKGKGGKNK